MDKPILLPIHQVSNAMGVAPKTVSNLIAKALAANLLLPVDLSYSQAQKIAKQFRFNFESHLYKKYKPVKAR